MLRKQKRVTIDTLPLLLDDIQHFTTHALPQTLPTQIGQAHTHVYQPNPDTHQNWWITKDLTHLAVAAAQNLPNDYNITELNPAPSGLIYYATPTGITIESINGPTPVTGIYWRHLPDNTRIWVDAITTNPTPTPGTTWPLGAGIAIGLPGRNINYKQVENLLAATWLLAHQDGITTHTQNTSTLHRAGTPAHIKRQPRAVTLINLRTKPRPPHQPRQDPDPDWYTIRFPVSGHWRQQPYGPGRKQRKLTYINPYIKGPTDAPLQTKPQIHVL
jgi:hypothetical protein